MTHHPQAQPHYPQPDKYYKSVVLGVTSLIRGVVIKYLWVYFCPRSSAGAFMHMPLL